MAIEAVIFDWGGTLTPWHSIDFDAEARALAAAVVDQTGAEPTAIAARLAEANTTIWSWSRDEQRSATLADVFEQAGLGHDPDRLSDYYDFWQPHTPTDPQAGPMFAALKERGIKVGVLSNTIWPRAWHREWFRRDGVLDLIDGDVYTSEIPWTKPSPMAFRTALEAVGATDPGRCVYVGDRLFDDIWGAHNAGLKAIHVPHSAIPASQIGHTEGEPDAIVHELAEIPAVVDRWN
ncbi:MAG: family hydrolase [Marmoricola sp.]|jgi:putative hydrolase of the HAD superfamily|nr:family hydrolase [Marmoricola sp.]